MLRTTTTPPPAARPEGLMHDTRCILCGRLFGTTGGPTPLPAHVYPLGLLRGRRCPSTYGVPVAPPVLARA
jgi:hypothetical protein